jgi:hypothetical protein
VLSADRADQLVGVRTAVGSSSPTPCTPRVQYVFSLPISSTRFHVGGRIALMTALAWPPLPCTPRDDEPGVKASLVQQAGGCHAWRRMGTGKDAQAIVGTTSRAARSQVRATGSVTTCTTPRWRQLHTQRRSNTPKAGRPEGVRVTASRAPQRPGRAGA